MTKPKPFAGGFLSLIICMLYFTGYLVNTWYFYPPSSCAVITWLVLGWSVFPLCPLRIQLQYWKKYYVLSMKLYGSL